LVRQAHQTRVSSSVTDRAERLALTDFEIRQTYLHNLSQLFPGIQLICQGETPSSELHFADSAFIQPDELLNSRKSMYLSPNLLQKTA